MTKREKSTAPIYGMAFIFALYTLIFPMLRWTDLLIAVAVAVISYIGLNKIFPGTLVEVEVSYKATGNKNLDSLLVQGRAYIQRLEELKQQITDQEINLGIANLQQISRQIFEYVAEKPEQARKINTFMNYYYPTAMKLLERYAKYDSKEIKGENIVGTLDKIKASVSKIEEAFRHQLDNLFSDSALDIETDIAVLNDIMKREGL